MMSLYDTHTRSVLLSMWEGSKYTRVPFSRRPLASTRWPAAGSSKKKMSGVKSSLSRKAGAWSLPLRNFRLGNRLPPGGADAGAEDVVAVPVLLVDTSEGGRASVGGVAHESAVASVPQEVVREFQPFGALIEMGQGEDFLPKP